MIYVSLFYHPSAPLLLLFDWKSGVCRDIDKSYVIAQNINCAYSFEGPHYDSLIITQNLYLEHK